MSARWFCDACNQELSDGLDWSERWAPKLHLGGHSFAVQTVIVSMDGTSNAGQLCRSCMTVLVTEGKQQ